MVSCGPQPKEQAESSEEAVEEEVVEAAGEEAVPEATLVIMHEVADFDAWKTAYDDHRSMREEAGLIDFGVFQQEGSANMVAVGFGCTDMAKAKEFMASEDLKSAMENAGVTGEPQVNFIKAEVVIEGESPSNDYLSVIHEVSDYSAWKTVFDGHEAARQESGLVLRDLSRSMDNPNEVWLLFAVTDRPGADVFMNGEDLAKAMEESGVVGEPQVAYWTQVTTEPM